MTMKKNDTVQISVIMGVFNPPDKAQFYKAVKSIIHQSFKGWEMILYDDGSEKHCAQMIKEAAAMDPRIRYIRGEKNHGLAYALNECIKYSKGKYIARMDADDISKPERLEKLYNFLESHPNYQWAGSNSELIDERGVWGIGERKEIPEKKDFLPFSPYIHPAVVFRKTVLVENQGYKVSETTKRCEDYELFMRLHEKGYRGYNIQEPLLQYREDYEAYKKRRYKYYIRESKVRFEGFRKLGILKPQTLPYVVKPLVVGLISPGMMRYIKKNIKRGYDSEQHKADKVS